MKSIIKCTGAVGYVINVVEGSMIYVRGALDEKAERRRAPTNRTTMDLQIPVAPAVSGRKNGHARFSS